jgi:hypothetical protein
MYRYLVAVWNNVGLSHAESLLRYLDRPVVKCVVNVEVLGNG